MGVDLNKLRDNLKSGGTVHVDKNGTVDAGSRGKMTAEPARFAA